MKDGNEWSVKLALGSVVWAVADNCLSFLLAVGASLSFVTIELASANGEAKC